MKRKKDQKKEGVGKKKQQPQNAQLPRNALPDPSILQQQHRNNLPQPRYEQKKYQKERKPKFQPTVIPHKR
jgi:hypothetical protein